MADTESPDSSAAPVVLITGAAGAIGGALAETLRRDYRVVGLDRQCDGCPVDCLEADLTNADSIEKALARFREKYGNRIASVVHLAAFFDFSGEPHPLYDKLNVEGTRKLLRALRDFDVGQFVYSGTMLVHQPAAVGERIDEDTPIAPKWVYPESKARAEEVIRSERGTMPAVLLHLAGLYDENTAVPTLTHQIARIYERDLKSYVYSGDMRAGQSMVHRDDMMDAFARTIDRRADLPGETTILIGEPDPMGYEELQDAISREIYGLEDWQTVNLPGPVAKAGAWAETKSEPVIPDAIDRGEKPFIRPFMIEMASDHYALDIDRARKLLGWAPRRRLDEELPRLIGSLRRDPLGWYEANGIAPPDWLEVAEDSSQHPEKIRARFTEKFRAANREFTWAHFLTIGLGTWLVTSPPIHGYEQTGMIVSDVVSGLALVAFGFAALSWRLSFVRWGAAAVGLWLLFAPLVFVANAAGYANGTLCGMLAIGFSVCARPPPGVGPLAAETGPALPPGWDMNPSDWLQRMPIIVLAFVGLYVSRYLAAYQLGHIDAVWEPFFAGSAADPQNGTEEIITSFVSKAWPVSDAGVGAITYALEILTGIIGSTRRWRTMPWLVILFGIMIVPLGVVSITFIVIQPIVIGTWCTLCLIAAAAMLVQIPYSLDELVATGQFLVRRRRAGADVLRVFFTGGTDDDAPAKGAEPAPEHFERPPGTVMKEMVCGAVNLPWNVALSIVVGVWLMFTRLALGTTGTMADADHLIGSLVVTVAVIACAEVARPARFVNALFGAALLATPFAFDADLTQTLASLACGLALIALSIPRGRIDGRYGAWNRWMV